MPTAMRSALHYLVIALFSAWPIMVFAAANINEHLTFGAFFVFALVNFAVGAGVFHVARFIFRSARPERIAAAVAIGISALYTFRVVRELLKALDLYSHASLMIAWVVIFVLVTAGAWFAIASPKALRGMAFVGAIMLLSSSASALWGGLTGEGHREARIAAETARGAAAERPNVYYLLMDAYVRSDMLKEMTGFDNEPFEAWLAEHGFRTLDRSRSNYMRSRQSIPSTWLMDYLPGSDDGYIVLGPDTWDIMGGNNLVVRALKELGYTYVFSGGREYCKKYVDKCVASAGILQGAPWIIIHSTPIPAMIYVLSDKLYAALLSSHSFITIRDAVRQISELDMAPRFVFYHELAVHRTIYNADCSLRKGLAMGEMDRMDQENRMLLSKEAYLAAVKCVNDNLRVLISEILTKDNDAIITITADHGASFRSINLKDRRENLKNAAYLRELSSTFSSWRLPGRCQKDLPADLSNVNHFRVILACLRGEEPKALPYRLYLPLTAGSADSGPVIRVPDAALESR